MKRSVFILVFTIFAAFAAPAQVKVGMTDTASYYPLLRGRRVAVLANQTSVAGASGRPAPRRRVCRRGDLLARARIPRHGRCRGAGRKFGRRPDGHSHPLALRRQRETAFGRGDALVRRAGRRHAGRGSALLYLLYLDAADGGRLRRFRPPGRGARPPQSQRASCRRSRSRHEVQIGRRGDSGPRAPRTDDGRNRPHGRGRGVGEAVRPDGREVPQLHPCHRIPLARRSVAQPADTAGRLSLRRAVPLRGHGREPRTRNGLPVRNLRTSRYDRTRLFLYAAPHGRGQTSAACRSPRPAKWDSRCAT